ncbi:MAG: aspartate kinase [Flavobacteriales bacterium]|nr:aspartate kinase [Flavobacteriales bacterium]MCB9190797.1 aspartate kinase [Flavobacteriales bacterium]
MRVFKFGGASVRDAESVKNVHNIISKYTDKPLVVVVSAMGKTTNKFENLVNTHFLKQPTTEILEDLRTCHGDIVKELFGDAAKPVLEDIDNTLVEVEWALDDPEGLDRHFQYDQIVSIGEMLSTKIISAYLKHQGLSNEWVDARDLIRTDNNYQDAKIEWDTTKEMTNARISQALKKANVVVTQGFIGGTSENFTTTLGREGSDFTAAILAHCLGAESVTIWKDVPGVLNADPKFYEDTVLIPEMSYFDAMELAYFGTSVIHPKTIKPLQNSNIPLYVRSFVDHDSPGTVVSNRNDLKIVPSFIVKPDQVLVSITPKDYSFVTETHFTNIYTVLSAIRMKANCAQNSAVNFSFSTNNDPEKLKELEQRLSDEYHLTFIEGAELVTVRYYDEDTISRITKGKNLLLDHRTPTSAQLVVK